MHIDSAIKMLQEEKSKGTKSIFLAYWTSEWFGREDDEQWDEDCSTAEYKTDLSYAHDAISDCLEMISEQNEEIATLSSNTLERGNDR